LIGAGGPGSAVLIEQTPHSGRRQQIASTNAIFSNKKRSRIRRAAVRVILQSTELAIFGKLDENE
jgi:hypothetical protein